MAGGIEIAKNGQTQIRAMIPAILVGTPALIFYGLLFKFLLNLPLYDDYGAVLGFQNGMETTHGMEAKLLLFLASQHNEYKLFFGHAVVWAQTMLLGHVNFAQLCVFGNSAVIIIAVLLWLMFSPHESDRGRRLTYFAPVSWLLFQLQYFETLDWAMASLQNLWVIAFSLGAISCLVRYSRSAYIAALVLYVLAIAASGNGLLLLPVGLLMLLTRRQYGRTLGWIAISAVCIAAYAYRYNLQVPATHDSVITRLLHIRPDFVVAFVGNAGAVAGSRPLSEWLALIVGIGLLVLFGWLLRRGYFRRNPTVGYCVLFLLLTAVGVGGLRSDLGLMQSLAPRYIIYGLLLVIFVWMAIVEEFMWSRRGPLLHDDAYLAVFLTTVFFALIMDGAGCLDLANRNRDTVKGMQEYEHPVSAASTDGPVLVFDGSNPVLNRLEPYARTTLSESIRLGVYEPPRY